MGAFNRKPIIAGNWKMFKTRDEALYFILKVSNLGPQKKDVDTIICAQAPMPALQPVFLLRCRRNSQKCHRLNENNLPGTPSALSRNMATFRDWFLNPAGNQEPHWSGWLLHMPV